MYTDRPYSVFQVDVTPRLATYPPTSKFIVYSNRRTKIEGVEEKLAAWLDSNDGNSKLAIVCLVGTLTKEQKAHYIDIFVNGSPEYCARFLLATSGAANAGIDCDNVYGVYRLDFPQSLLDISQEKGRAGQLLSENPEKYFYHLSYSMESYLHLFNRITDPLDSTVDAAYRTSQLNDLQEVLQILVTPKIFFQLELEFRLSNPASRNNGDENLPCGYCTFCTKYDHIPSFRKEGLSNILFNLLVHGQRLIQNPRTVSSFIKSVTVYPGALMALFGTNSRQPIAPKLIKQIFLGLIVAGIMRMDQAKQKEDDPSSPDIYNVVVELTLHSPGVFAMHEDSYWTTLPTTE
jgi:hypothetical protein